MKTLATIAVYWAAWVLFFTLYIFGTMTNDHITPSSSTTGTIHTATK